MDDLLIDTATSTPVIPLSANGSDPDGSFTGLQFYVDGKLPTDQKSYDLLELPSSWPLILPDSNLMPLELKQYLPSVAIIVEIMWLPEIRNLSVTTGSGPADIALTGGPISEGTYRHRRYQCNLQFGWKHHGC